MISSEVGDISFSTASLPLDVKIQGLQSEISSYYTQKILKHGPTPRGVDWSCNLTQQLRFAKLLTICKSRRHFSLNDIGCGYGAMLEFLSNRFPKKNIDYLGIDLSEAMISEAKSIWKDQKNTVFLNGDTCSRIADYSIASGIFNIKLTQSTPLWESYIEKTLHSINSCSLIGFSVNFLESAQEGSPAPAEIYRSKSERWIEYCQHFFGAEVELVRGYGLGEYTLLVRKDSPKSS